MLSWRQKKSKLRGFVNSLSEKEVREELYLAYLQMERCQQVLEGEDVEPVKMRENGLDSDLELFYMCKKMRTELDRPADTVVKAIMDDAARYVRRIPVKVIEKSSTGRFRERSVTYPDIIVKII